MLHKIGSLIVAALAAGALIAAGCKVGPDFKPPKPNVPGQYTGVSAGAGSGSITTGQATDISEWWESFQDPQLNGLIQQALQANLNLQQAQARILQAREARVIVKSGLYPVVGSSGSTTVSGAHGSGASSRGTRNLFQAGLDSSWELDLFGGIRRNVESADARTQAAIEDSRDIMVTMTSELALNYTQLRGVQQQLAIARKNLDLQQRTAEITRKRFEVGFTSGLDVQNANAQVATTQSVIPRLESTAQQTIYNISVLLAREPAALLSELSPRRDIPASPPVVPVGLPSDLLQRRPDIRRAEADLHAATAQVGVAKAELFPQIALVGSAGVQALTAGALGTLASSFWSIGPGVAFPLFNAGRLKANVRLQEDVVREVFLGYQQTVLNALRDVETALIAYAKDQEHRESLQDAVKANRRAVELATEAYTAGQVDFLNVLAAQRNLFLTEDALIQSDRLIAEDLIALYKALGGGW